MRPHSAGGKWNRPVFDDSITLWSHYALSVPARCPLGAHAFGCLLGASWVPPSVAPGCLWCFLGDSWGVMAPRTHRKHTANTPQTHRKHTANTSQTHRKHTANTPQTHRKHTAKTTHRKHTAKTTATFCLSKINTRSAAIAQRLGLVTL